MTPLEITLSILSVCEAAIILALIKACMGWFEHEAILKEKVLKLTGLLDAMGIDVKWTQKAGDE